MRLGVFVGPREGVRVGKSEGRKLGVRVGGSVGKCVGVEVVGLEVGIDTDGPVLGYAEIFQGARVGIIVGL